VPSLKVFPASGDSGVRRRETAMRYDSFLLRFWRRDDEQRIEVAHLQSGERTRIATLAAATDWIGVRCDGTTEGGTAAVPSATGEEEQTGEAPRGDEERSSKPGARAAPEHAE
jgi:hypothetical protein